MVFSFLGWALIGLVPAWFILLGLGCVCFADIGGAASQKDYFIGWGVISFGAFLAYHWWLIRPFTMAISPS